MTTDLFIEIEGQGLRADIVLRNAYPLFTGKDGSLSNQICP